MVKDSDLYQKVGDYIELVLEIIYRDESLFIQNEETQNFWLGLEAALVISGQKSLEQMEIEDILVSVFLSRENPISSIEINRLRRLLPLLVSTYWRERKED